jgi:enamine deaminase RidA (YjgF/YER057c/UK114 family)
MRKHISSGSTFEEIAGYSRALVDDDFVYVSGTTGFDYGTMLISDDLGEQTHQAMKNIEDALAKAGASLDDVVRAHYYLTSPADFEIVGPIIGRYLNKARPAASAVVVGLIDQRMKIEIEVTARRPQGVRAE